MMRHNGIGSGMEWMHWGGALIWLLVALVLVLAIAALVKYLRGP